MMKSKSKLLKVWLAVFIMFAVLIQQIPTTTAFAENETLDYEEKVAEISESDLEQETAEASDSGSETAKPLDVNDKKSDENIQMGEENMFSDDMGNQNLRRSTQDTGGNREEKHWNDVITEVFVSSYSGEIPIGNLKVNQWQEFRLNAKFVLPDNQVKQGDKTIFTLPDVLTFSKNFNFQIPTQDGSSIVANAVADPKTKTITLTYTDYPEKHSGVMGSFYIYVYVNHEVVKQEQDVPISIVMENGTFVNDGNVHYNGANPLPPARFMYKEGWTTSDLDVHEHLIKINQTGQKVNNAVLEDELQEPAPGVKYVRDSLRVTKGTWYADGNVWKLKNETNISDPDITWETTSDGREKFTLRLGNIAETEGYRVYYRVKLGYEPSDGEQFHNKAKLTGSDIQTTEHINTVTVRQAGGSAEGYLFKIQVYKKGEKEQPLSGAKFDVIRVRNNLEAGTIETGPDGKGEIGNLLRDKYKLVETKAPDGYKPLTDPIIVDVGDFGDNKIALKNISNELYKATGSWTPVVTKTLTGRALADDEFEFELKEGGNVLQTVKNKSDGSIPFAAINYTLEGVGEHTYTITEKPGSLSGVTYDGLTVTYKVKVEDKGDGTLTVTETAAPADKEFNNAYAATGSWTPVVTKTLTGRALADDEFEFELKEGGNVLQTVKNKSDGSIPFAAINYTLEGVGEHTYTITEKAGSLTGITYDTMTVTYKVKVSDKGDGTLEAKVTVSPVDTEFNNKFEIGVTFSKVEAGQGTELAGAEITVSGTDANGQAFSESWTSDGTAKVLKLKAGEYKMVEDQAPLGYDKAAEIEFRVNPDGTAKVLKLKAGEYKMVENKAPKGYKLAGEIIFRVNKDGSVEVKSGSGWVEAKDAKIRMIDKPEANPVPTPKTDDGTNAAFYSSLGILALGSALTLDKISRKKKKADKR